MSLMCEAILAGVDSVTIDGNPGTMVIHGSNSEAILTNKSAEVIIAAGFLGEGRAVIFTHDYLTKQFIFQPDCNHQLIDNIKSWVTNDRLTDDDEVEDIEDYDDFEDIPSSCKILVWTGLEDRDVEFCARLVEWIQNGGGFVGGITPWGYLQLKPGRTLYDMPLSVLLKPLGISYTDMVMEGESPLYVSENCVDCSKFEKAKIAPESDTTSLRKFGRNIEQAYENMSAMREAILVGVDSVTIDGHPGTMVVNGSNSEAILTNKSAEVIIAGGFLGEGRAVIFTHDYLTKQFIIQPDCNHQLIDNIKSWVTNGRLAEDERIENIADYNNFEDIPSSCKILVWTGLEDRNKKCCEQLIEWIKNGGGFVGGVTPWGYLYLNPSRTLYDMPLFVLLESLGISYTDRYMQGESPLYVSENCSDICKFEKALKACDSDITKLRKLGRSIEQAISFMSHKEFVENLPRITAMIEKHMKTTHCIPTRCNPVKTDEGKGLAALMNTILLETGQFNENKVADGIKEFPGDFEKPPSLVTTTVRITASGHPSRTFPTGYYLPAGQEAIVSFLYHHPEGWNIVIGAHKDENHSVSDDWRRWPKIQIVKPLGASPLKISSPFGGGVYLKSPDTICETVTVKLENVTPSPMFVHDCRDSWDEQSKHEGLWADIVGDKLTITLPSSSVRALADPSETMATWDMVLSAHIELRGCDPSDGRGQWVVTDEQPVCGYMHAGYPVITGLDVADPCKEGDDGFLLNCECIKTGGRIGMWGMFHELGHNMQDDSWTWQGTSEVTCNIFTLHAMEKIADKKPWTHPWLRNQFPAIKNYLQEGASFQKWLENPYVGLGIYAQLARDFGWRSYKAIFREYDHLKPYEKPKTDDQKIDHWIRRFCNVTHTNLCPMFDFWGFPIRVLNDVRKYPAYLHNDETTREMAPERAASIRAKYGLKPLGEFCDFL